MTYGYQELLGEGDIDALTNKSRRAPNLKNRVDEAIENALKAYAVDFRAHGQHRTSYELRKQGVIDLVILQKDLDEWLINYNNNRTHQTH